MNHNKKKVKIALACIAPVLVLCFIAATFFVFKPYFYANYFIAPAPSNLSKAGSVQAEAVYGDFYISPDGNDANDGSKDRPFATFEAAQKAVRMLNKELLSHVVVSVKAGTYRTNGLTFKKKDSGTDTCRVIYCAYGDGEVILDGTADYSAAKSAENTSLISIDGTVEITFSGFTVTNTAGNGITASGKNIDISSCTVRNVSGTGISANGTGINIGSCTLSHIGGSAIAISGGKIADLTPGNCSADNNLVYNTSELDASLPAVSVEGVGNVISNNEIFNTPSTAIHFTGNGNIIEFNYIHNAVLTDKLACAIASPMCWNNYGNFLRRNCVSTLGDGKSKPNGMAVCSGTQVYDNLLVNVPGTGIDLMGGRDIAVTNNIIVNSSIPLNYDSAPYADELAQNGEAWQTLKASPYQSKVWKEAFPDCSRLLFDAELNADPMYAANPANSIIENNVILQAESSIGNISGEAAKFSRIANNAVYNLEKDKIFTDMKNGIYILAGDSPAYDSVKSFTDLPFDSMGRY